MLHWRASGVHILGLFTAGVPELGRAIATSRVADPAFDNEDARIQRTCAYEYPRPSAMTLTEVHPVYR